MGECVLGRCCCHPAAVPGSKPPPYHCLDLRFAVVQSLNTRSGYLSPLFQWHAWKTSFLAGVQRAVFVEYAWKRNWRERQRGEPLGRSGGMSPQECFSFRGSEMQFSKISWGQFYDAKHGKTFGF